MRSVNATDPNADLISVGQGARAIRSSARPRRTVLAAEILERRPSIGDYHASMPHGAGVVQEHGRAGIASEDGLAQNKRESASARHLLAGDRRRLIADLFACPQNAYPIGAPCGPDAGSRAESPASRTSARPARQRAVRRRRYFWRTCFEHTPWGGSEAESSRNWNALGCRCTSRPPTRSCPGLRVEHGEVSQSSLHAWGIDYPAK